MICGWFNSDVYSIEDDVFKSKAPLKMEEVTSAYKISTENSPQIGMLKFRL